MKTRSMRATTGCKSQACSPSIVECASDSFKVAIHAIEQSHNSRATLSRQDNGPKMWAEKAVEQRPAHLQHRQAQFGFCYTLFHI